MSHQNSTYDDEDYFLPLEDQRVFGAGIKRKRVPFVRPSDHATLSTTNSSTIVRQSSEPAASVADRYLSIVLPKRRSAQQKLDRGDDDDGTVSAPSSLGASPVPLGGAGGAAEGGGFNRTKLETHRAETTAIVSQQQQKLCEVCNLPLTTTETTTTSSSSSSSTVEVDGEGRPKRPPAPPTPHEASIAHQVCLAHSHPPSHLDRTRPGLRYLASFGWDPDSRLGLGAPGREGIRAPIKPKPKHDTTGLGMENDPNAEKRERLQKQKEERQKLNAKQVRMKEMEAKKKGDKLRELFYRSEDVQRYLGEGG
jgi:hypothetical protein